MWCLSAPGSPDHPTHCWVFSSAWRHWPGAPGIPQGPAWLCLSASPVCLPIWCRKRSRIFTCCLVICEAKDNLNAPSKQICWTCVFTHSLTSSSLFSSCLMYSFSDITRSFSVFSRSVIWPTSQKVKHHKSQTPQTSSNLLNKGCRKTKYCTKLQWQI